MSIVARLFPLVLATLFAGPAAAELAKWDQARVTSIATQLASAVTVFEEAIRENPDATRVGEGAAFGMQENVRELRVQSEALAAHLKGGKGHDQTRDLYRSLKEVMDDTEQHTQRSPVDAPVMDAWAKVTDLMRQIAPYYDPKAADEAS